VSGRLKRPVDDVDAARAAVRELHEAMKEARLVLRELQAARDRLGSDVEGLIVSEVTAGLARYSKTLDRALAEGTQKMFDRFDKLADAFLDGPRRRRRGVDPTLIELAAQAELDEDTRAKVRAVRDSR
jgi:hypothetical protein